MAQLCITKGKLKQVNPERMHRLFEKYVNEAAEDAIAIQADDLKKQDTLSFSTLNSMANKYARAFIHLPLSEKTTNIDGDCIIGIFMEHSMEMIAVMLAIWKAGAAYMPIDKIFSEELIEKMINESQPMLTIYDDEKSASVFNCDVRKISIARLKRIAELETSDNIYSDHLLANPENDLALVFYTSGSTGSPRGVKLSHSNIYNRFDWQWEYFPFQKTEKFSVFKTPFSFVDSIAEIWSPLINGVTIVLTPPALAKDPENFVNLLAKYKIERLILVPALLQDLIFYLINTQPGLLPDLKNIICSGETLPLALVKDFFKYFKDDKHIICNFYGATEVMGDCLAYVIQNQKQLHKMQSVPIGKPINNTMIYILDAEFRPVRYGEIGEIFVAGFNVAQGYVRNRSVERFSQNPFSIDETYSSIFKTGDLASYKDGIIYFEGRADCQAKIRGHRVNLAEIEIQLLKLQYIEKACVLCYLPREIDQTIVAFVVLRPQQKMTEADIEKDIKPKIMSYIRPTVVILDSFPYTYANKLDRVSLLARYAESRLEMNIKFDYTDVPPHRMAAAKDLFEIVAEVIGYSKHYTISVTSNFYEIGGTSLNTMFVIGELKNRGYIVSIISFIAAANLGLLLARISTPHEEKIINIETALDDIKSETNIELFMEIIDPTKKHEIIDMISSSFLYKSQIEKYFKPHVKKENLKDYLLKIWDDILLHDCSFMVTDVNQRIVGVSINFDFRNEPETYTTNPFGVILEFVQYLDQDVRDHLPSGLNQILNSFMIASHADMSAKENVAILIFIEIGVIKIAQEKRFSYILSINTTPATQLIDYELGYKTLSDMALCDFVFHDGTRPFVEASESVRALVAIKSVEKLK